MKKTETIKILSIITTAYPKMESPDAATDLWHDMIGELDFSVAQIAVRKLISESPFPPTIHDIRRCAMEVCNPNMPTPAEAWGIINKNIRKYGSYNVEEGMAALPPLIQEVMRHIGYLEFCRSEEPEGVLRAQFMRMYEQVLNRRRNEQMLPLPLREQIKAIAANLVLPEGGAT